MTKVICMLMALLVTLLAHGANRTEVGVTFDYGSAELPHNERQKLLILAQQAEEAGERVLIQACIDSTRDAARFNRAQLLQRLKEEKFRDLLQKRRIPPTMTASRIELLPGDHEQYHQAVIARTGITGRKKPGTVDLQSLALRRAERVKDYLIDHGHLPPSRIVTEIHRREVNMGETGGVKTFIRCEANS